MNKIAIFDLDGTLLNTIQDLAHACNYALDYFNLPTHPISLYPQLVGNGINKLIERALPQNQKTQENILKLRQVFIPYYNTHNMVFTKPYDHITQTLLQLKQKQYLLAVASNKYQDATNALINHFFPNTFQAVLGERDNSPRKPNPQIIYDILTQLHQPKHNNIFYIGDSDTDILTAHNASLPVIACTWGFCNLQTLQQLKPEFIINSPQEILNIL